MPSIEKARTEQVKEEVTRKLEGLPERQAQRDAARALRQRMKLIYRLRREGKMSTLEQGRGALLLTGLTGSEENYYGITILHSKASVSLAYDRQGNLSWASRPIRQDHEDTQEIFDFSDELSASAGDDDFLSLLDGLPIEQ